MRNESFVMPFYKYRIGCDIDIGGEKSDERVDIVLTSESGNPEERENIYEHSSEEYRILSPIASYYIYPAENRMHVRYDYPEQIRSTLCSLPASVLAGYKGELILHSSSVEMGGKVVAFCAEKGTGKTSLVSYLGRVFPVFSDDTLYLENSSGGINCYSASNTLRLTHASARGHGEQTESLYNAAPKTVQNKAHLSCTELGLKSIRPGTPGKLGAIVCLRRSGERAGIVRIDAGTARFGALLNNCVGAAFLPPYILKSIIRSDYFAKLLECVPILELTLPDSFEFLRDGYVDIAEMIRTYI